MKTLTTTLLALAIFSFCEMSHAESKKHQINATCKNPTGYVYDYGVKTDPVGADDGFNGATWSFFWDSSNPTKGDVITQDSSNAGGESTAAAAAVIQSNDKTFTFFVPYDSGVWFYTLFLDSKIMLASRHVQGMYISGGTFHSKCTIA